MEQIGTKHTEDFINLKGTAMNKKIDITLEGWKANAVAIWLLVTTGYTLASLTRIAMDKYAGWGW